MTNIAPMPQVNVKTLADKAMLARLARRRMNTSVRDKALEAHVRHETQDDSVIVTKHLFRVKSCYVRKLISKYDEVYRLHMDSTMPWIDRGPRLLPSKLYFNYMERMRQAIEEVDQLVPFLFRNWGSLVDQDVISRGGTASGHDYPSAATVANAFSIDLQILPLPDTSDFRVDVDDATRDALQGALQEAEQAARADIIRRMLEPVERAVEKLQVPIGEQGSVFRDSLVSNLLGGIHQAKLLNISDDADLSHAIEEIEARVTAVAKPEALRNSVDHRTKAAKELADIMGKLGTL